MLPFIAVLFGCIALLYFALLGRRRLLLNAGPIFILGQLLMFFGAYPLLDPSLEADVVHAMTMLGVLVAFFFGAFAAEIVSPIRGGGAWWAQETDTAEEPLFRYVAFFLIASCLVVSTLYYRAVGTNIFADSLMSFLRTGRGMENALEVRELFYAGPTYLAPGYVNQFKNIIFPTLTVYFLLRYELVRESRDAWIGFGMMPFAVASLLGTGQRGAFVDAVIMAFLAAMAVLPARRRRRYGTAFAIGGLFLFSLATYFLGRGTSTGGPAERGRIASTLLEVWERGIWGNQLTSVVGFRYVYSLPSVNGWDWWQDAMQLLPKNLFPSKTGTTLPLDIFEILYGGRSGTAPPSLWGSTWYNFGLIGTLLVALFLGFTYQRLYARLLRGPKRLSRLIVYSGIVVTLGTWLVGGPGTLFNRGLITLVLLQVILHPSRLLGPAWAVRRRNAGSATTGYPAHRPLTDLRRYR